MRLEFPILFITAELAGPKVCPLSALPGSGLTWTGTEDHGRRDAYTGRHTYRRGARLRAAREAKQLSVREVAKTTKIPVGALDALEANDVARLPGGIFSRGFVRSYAAAVGLHPEQTLRDFVAQLPAHETAADAVSADRPHGYHHATRQRRVAGPVLGGVLGLWRGGDAPVLLRDTRPAHPHRDTTGASRRGGTGTGAVASSGGPGP